MPPKETEDDVTRGLGDVSLGEDDPDEGDLLGSDKDDEDDEEEEEVIPMSGTRNRQSA